jgi:hypothetical protein
MQDTDTLHWTFLLRQRVHRRSIPSHLLRTHVRTRSLQIRTNQTHTHSRDTSRSISIRNSIQLPTYSQSKKTISMSTPRTIEIRIHNDCKTVPFRVSMQNAIGYLSMWGNSDHVILYIDKDYNIDTSHQRKLDPLDPRRLTAEFTQYYFIAGIYDAKTDTYSFHS